MVWGDVRGAGFPRLRTTVSSGFPRGRSGDLPDFPREIFFAPHPRLRGDESSGAGLVCRHASNTGRKYRGGYGLLAVAEYSSRIYR